MDRVNGVNAAELAKKVRHHAGLPAVSVIEASADKVCICNRSNIAVLGMLF